MLDDLKRNESGLFRHWPSERALRVRGVERAAIQRALSLANNLRMARRVMRFLNAIAACLAPEIAGEDVDR